MDPTLVHDCSLNMYNKLRAQGNVEGGVLSCPGGGQTTDSVQDKGSQQVS